MLEYIGTQLSAHGGKTNAILVWRVIF